MAEVIEGPLCAYWDVEDAPMCGHGSCYKIVHSQDVLLGAFDMAPGYGGW